MLHANDVGGEHVEHMRCQIARAVGWQFGSTQDLQNNSFGCCTFVNYLSTPQAEITEQSLWS